MKYALPLQWYRKKARLTQHEFAEAVGGGVTQTLVSMWETGVAVPTPDQKRTIAKVLKVTELELFQDSI